MKMFLRFASFSLLLALATLPALAGNRVTGRVINATSKQPSAGDEVLLLRLGEGMQQESRAISDAAGNFSLPVNQPQIAHLVRVIHQGVNYDERLSASSSLEIKVFDSVPHVPSLSGPVGMAQIEPDGATLKVTEMYDITNVSQPPVTQVGPRNFEFSIASGGTIEAFQARKGGGVWVNLNPVAVAGSVNRYAVDFPIRPGDTLFRFSYRLPANAAAQFNLRPAYPVSNFAVMHPPSIAFKASRAADFTSPGVTKGLRIEQVVSSSPLHEIPAFEISAVGTAPVAGASPAGPVLGTAAVSIPVPRSSSPAGNRTFTATENGGGFWPLLVAFACLFAAIVFGSRRRKRQASAASGSGPRERMRGGKKKFVLSRGEEKR
jgi:hypothetical protein